MATFRNFTTLISILFIFAAHGQVPSIKTGASGLGVAWGFSYGHEAGGHPVFMPALRDMGVNRTKLYLFWQQIEPVEGRYDWTAVDAFLAQLDEGDEALIAVWSVSRWATRVSTSMLPPSPAKDAEAYHRFIVELVSRCKGRIRYWQNDCEPNNPVYWNGSADEFIGQLKVFHRAVKTADPDAQVVVGGYDGLFNPPGMREYPGQAASLAFFDRVIREGTAYFDVFDLRLYGDPYTIPDRVSYFRGRLETLGNGQPVICTEYNGPGFYAFPENRAYIDLAMQWQRSVADLDTAAYKAIANPIQSLYDSIASLAPVTQMFLMGCDSALDAKYYRIQCRDIVQRNLLAFSAGVAHTYYWDFWHDTADTLNLMTLMYGKNKLMEYRGGKLANATPMPHVIRRLVRHLGPFDRIRRVDTGDSRIFLFHISLVDGRPRYVLWERRDAFSGEDQPDSTVTVPWPHAAAMAEDLFGNPLDTMVREGELTINLSADPVFIN